MGCFCQEGHPCQEWGLSGDGDSLSGDGVLCQEMGSRSGDGDLCQQMRGPLSRDEGSLSGDEGVSGRK